jgi:hypothetical protein
LLKKVAAIQYIEELCLVAALELDGKITQWKSAIASANNVMQSASQFGKIEQQTSMWVLRVQ